MNLKVAHIFPRLFCNFCIFKANQKFATVAKLCLSGRFKCSAYINKVECARRLTAGLDEGNTELVATVVVDDAVEL